MWQLQVKDMCWMFLNHLITFIIINHMIDLRTSALIN